MTARVEPADLVPTLAGRYGLADAVSCELLRAGFNDNYSVDASGESYVFRLYLNDKYYITSEDDFRFELDLLTHLRARGLPVAAPVPARDGETLVAVDAGGVRRWGALFPVAPGARPERGDDAFVASLGDAVARIHLAADEFRSPHHRYTLDRRYLLDDPVRHIEAVFAQYECGSLDASRPLLDELSAALDSAPRGDGAFGIIHADLHRGNLHVDGDGFTLFDFDHCAYGWRAYDLATVRMSLEDGAWSRFLGGYAAVRAPSDQELALIPAFRRLRHLWDIGDVLAMHAAWGRDVPRGACERIAEALRQMASEAAA